MSGDSTRLMTFQASPPDVVAALREAARRTGFRYLSEDAGTGTALLTSGRFLLMFGEKVNARWRQVAPGAVQVTMSTAKFGIAVAGRRPGGSGVDRLSDELSRLLPHAG